MTHDPALCPLNYCQLCDVFGAGYTRGKEIGRREAINEILDAIRPVVDTLVDHVKPDDDR